MDDFTRSFQQTLKDVVNVFLLPFREISKFGQESFDNAVDSIANAIKKGSEGVGQGVNSAFNGLGFLFPIILLCGILVVGLLLIKF